MELKKYIFLNVSVRGKSKKQSKKKKVFGCIHVLVSDCHRWDFVLYMKIIELNKMQYFTQVNEF